MRIRRLILRYGVPALLILAAANQQVLVHLHDLTPWKGAGFGMFATVDGPEQRILQVTILSRGEWSAANTAELLRRESPVRHDLLRARAFPAQRSISRALASLCELPAPGAESVRLEIWAQSYQVETRRVTPRLIVQEGPYDCDQAPNPR